MPTEKLIQFNFWKIWLDFLPYLKVFSVSSDCYNKIPQTEWLKQQKYVPQSSGSREAWGQGAGGFGVWWSPAFWFTDGSLLAVLLQGRRVKRLLCGLFCKGIISFTRVPLSWPNHLPRVPPLNIIITLKILTYGFGWRGGTEHKNLLQRKCKVVISSQVLKEKFIYTLHP